MEKMDFKLIFKLLLKKKHSSEFTQSSLLKKILRCQKNEAKLTIPKYKLQEMALALGGRAERVWKRVREEEEGVEKF